MSRLLSSEDCAFDLGGFCLRGKRWGSRDGIPVLALHGWLDNCGSFDFLAPLLPQLDLIALDLAGHGLSDHRSARGAYNVWQDVGEIFAVADQLGWTNFGLLGHSRGAVMAALAAGTFPERVRYLALIEGICPHLDPPEMAPVTLAASISHINQQLQRPRRYYSTFVDAVKAREIGLSALSHKDALALAERGVEHAAQGYAWRYDSKVTASSELRLTAAQMNAFVSRIQARQQLILSKNGLHESYPQIRGWLAQHPEIRLKWVPGDHHCHMTEGAQRVADELEELWG